MKLALCLECRRHTVAGEPCAHCGSVAQAPEPASRVARLSRAAVLASTAAVAASAACAGGSSAPRTPASPAPTDEVSAAVYGGPPPDVAEAEGGAAPELTADAAVRPPMAIYGGPPPNGR